MFDELNDNPDQLQLPSVQGDEFLPRIGLWAMVGGLFLVGTFGVAVALSSVLNYKVAVKVPATIRPAGELRLIQPAIASTVKQIDAKGNQRVTKGQAIAHLDDSRLQIQKSQLQESIRQMKLQLGQIKAQVGSMDAQIVAESNLLDRSLAAAQADLANSRRDYRDQQIVTQANLTEAQSSLAIARAQRDRLEREKELEATLREAQAALKVAKVQRDRLKKVLDSGAISQNQFEEKAQAVESAQAKLEQTRAAAKKLAEEKAQAVASAKAGYKRAQAALNPSDASVTVATEKVGLEQAQAKATLAGLSKERETLVERRIGLQNQLDQAQKDLQQVETNLNQTVIRAPVEGVLLQLQLRNQGQVVQPGEAIARVAPSNAPLLIKAQVPSQEIDKVELGQTVQMQVSACPHPDFGTLKGTVETVAPDALPAASKGEAPVVPATPATYEVTIQPKTQAMGTGDRQCHLQAGMEGRANIISREETILKFILRKTRLLTDL